MSPERRFGVTLFVSLAFWFPTLQELLADNVTLTTALLRYAAGLGVAWITVGGIDRLLTGYRQANLARSLLGHMRRSTDERRDIGESDDSSVHPDANPD